MSIKLFLQVSLSPIPFRSFLSIINPLHPKQIYDILLQHLFLNPLFYPLDIFLVIHLQTLFHFQMRQSTPSFLNLSLKIRNTDILHLQMVQSFSQLCRLSFFISDFNITFSAKIPTFFFAKSFNTYRRLKIPFSDFLPSCCITLNQTWLSLWFLLRNFTSLDIELFLFLFPIFFCFMIFCMSTTPKLYSYVSNDGI